MTGMYSLTRILIQIVESLIESVYLTLFPGYLESGQFHAKSRMRSSVDAHSGIYYGGSRTCVSMSGMSASVS